MFKRLSFYACEFSDIHFVRSCSTRSERSLPASWSSNSRAALRLVSLRTKNVVGLKSGLLRLPGSLPLPVVTLGSAVDGRFDGRLLRRPKAPSNLLFSAMFQQLLSNRNVSLPRSTCTWVVHLIDGHSAGCGLLESFKAWNICGEQWDFLLG